ncbi:glycoside hydrolase domain-containing protein [Flavihumibacter solisilvae]|uniref:Glycoside hydrolase 123-like N-terminal domain-containing protein n=1 Tax=Flavihumibacter solisilvae TaxID=1349421 RepID=A0A0C1L8K4_9BACT|nr:glycoside hydrolase domain-containing protein [Flavihumibacter solisilvae]KIC96487.1 hypothetical protein OI18_01810 [Flavihumibacter solisilvae]
MRKLFHLAVVAFSSLAVNAQELKYTDGKNSWDADSLGNHRVVITYSGSEEIARAVIPWRRPDDHPELKRIIIEDGKTHKKVHNVKTEKIDAFSCDILFEPVSGSGTYYMYYMPSKNEGRSNYPKGVYLKPEVTASEIWLNKIKTNTPLSAKATEIQSIDAFNSFFPMEVVASPSEVKTLLANYSRKDMIVFPEDRMYPIRMNDRLPSRWIKKGTAAGFEGKAFRGEFYSFQLGLYALRQLEDVTVSFSSLKSASGLVIPASAFSCINTSGTDYKTQKFVKSITVNAGQVQALWCLVTIPRELKPGKYTGFAEIKARNTAPLKVRISIGVDSQVVPDGAIDEPWKQTRLHWLNSTLYQENKVIAPYIPLEIENTNITLLGRKVKLNNDGLPAGIQTFFNQEMTGYTKTANELLSSPIAFSLVNADDGNPYRLSPGGITFTRKEEGTVQWNALSSGDAIQMHVNGSLEFDGFLQYTVKITALKDVHLSDINMVIPFQRSASRYMMGLGQKGGNRPVSYDWKWEVATKNQDGAWIGSVNAGLQYSLRDEKYVRPLNTNFYLLKPLNLPTSWGNENKGGVTIRETGNTALVNNYSGARQMKKGDTLYYNFTLLITPFHTIDTDFQWENRFYHKASPVDTIKASGATVVNIHHANAINPWINYPFIEHKKMKSFIDSAHSAGLKVKIYNTVRELSNKAYETFPLRSLGHEIYSPGKGGGFSWLQEHVHDDYIAAWFVPGLKDAAIVNSGMSRWHNYYVEGMNWLVRNVGIDGIYLDDVAFDRITMKRIKRALTQDHHSGIIDLHSANQFNKSDGFNNSGNLYLEHFPYLNRLWFGEYFDYQKNSPDFFLTEISGIPFGLMGEMLEGGGNPWRGMLYGMTNRYPWSDSADPRNIWKAWDAFGMKGSEMIGYWSENCPVRTSNPQVLATVYRKKGQAMISLASWASADTTITLQIDWTRLGINPAKARIEAPAIKNFQPAKTFGADEQIPVEMAKGWIIIIKENGQ